MRAAKQTPPKDVGIFPILTLTGVARGCCLYQRVQWSDKTRKLFWISISSTAKKNLVSLLALARIDALNTFRQLHCTYLRPVFRRSIQGAVITAENSSKLIPLFLEAFWSQNHLWFFLWRQDRLSPSSVAFTLLYFSFISFLFKSIHAFEEN